MKVYLSSLCKQVHKIHEEQDKLDGQ